MAGKAAYVACNVYVSAGRQGGAPILLDVLAKAQQRCQYLRRHKVTASPERNDHTGTKIAHTKQLHPIALVHAFADVPYDRSSFHLAGTADCVADVASLIATQALKGLAKIFDPVKATCNSSEPDEEPGSRHPYVGIVDHVAVMPLLNTYEKSTGTRTDDSFQVSFEAPDANGQTAIQIGQAISEVGAKVYYYGSADPDYTPLAQVRRECTKFFKSGGLKEESKVDTHATGGIYGVATVGAPSSFVENYNIRLSATCSKTMARSLTKIVREKDGGIVGVEALTLPYSEGRYEVACNLLDPERGSADMILKAATKWAENHGGESCIDKAYRVGTTAEQCIGALSNTDVDEHDKAVYHRFTNYMSSSA
mmetsp:Transcript_21742/g.47410  ORF Transcript_21742/g.47410 Transcript_21742/m.47410 type:complete len:366 (-) Transcript_21742:1353-2450(-)